MSATKLRGSDTKTPSTKFGLPPIPHRLSVELQRVGYTAIVVAGPVSGRPISFSCTSDLHKHFASLQRATWEELRIHFLVWTAGRPLAERIEREVHAFLNSAQKKIRGGWFDVPAYLAKQAVLLGADKQKVPVFTHQQMIERCKDLERRRFLRLVDEGSDLTEKRRHGNFSARSGDDRPYASTEGVSPYLANDPRRQKPRKKKDGRKDRPKGRDRTRDKPKRDHPYR